MNPCLLLVALTLSIAALFADVTQGGFGAANNQPKPPPASPKPESKRTTYPFYGTLDSVDPAKKTVTLRGKKKNRILLLTPQTRVQKNGAKAKPEDGTPGERVSGSVQKTADGREEALTLTFGKKKTGE